MARCQSVGTERPVAILSLPCLDFASVFIASGVVAERFRDPATVAGDLEVWRGRVGEDVSFPFKRRNDEDLRRLKGCVQGFDEHNGRKRLLIRCLDQKNKSVSRAIDLRWLPLIQPLSDTPDLENTQGGSLLAESIYELELLVGQAGVCRLLGGCHEEVCIVDIKSRVLAETKMEIPFHRLGSEDQNGEIILRDLVRLASEGPVAMAETHCCRVFGEAQSGWPVTIIAGALRFLRSWEDCESGLRIALFSPVENAYGDAVELANYMFERRGAVELDLPKELLRLKPAAIDLQLMYSD